MHMSKKKISLAGKWQFKEYPVQARRMRDVGDDLWSECSVPGTIFGGLIEAGIIEEFDFLANPEKYEYVSEKPWLFQKNFDCPDDILAMDKCRLVFDGLDTVSSIWLNGKLIAKTSSMFIQHRIDITKYLQSKDNHLMVKLDSAIDYSNRLEKRYGQLIPDKLGHSGRVYMRKAQYQFGWDFSPSLPGCGIFRDVRIEGVKKARIENLYIRTVDCSEEFADIRVSLELEKAVAGDYSCRLKMLSPGGGQAGSCDLEFHRWDNYLSAVLRVDKPSLWWPADYGKQPIYEMQAELFSGDETVDNRSENFGIRIVKLNRSKDKAGTSFAFEVNDKEIYCKGANWVGPGVWGGVDCEKLVASASAANMNMLRVWGGGCYESDLFYDTCDKLGILVWQDFMFACAYYPDRGWFVDEVKAEAKQVVKRLRNHPCIALWCGNNEIHWMHRVGLLGAGRKFYGKTIYDKILPGIVAEFDHDLDYINSTPFGNDKNPNEPSCGTVHNWQVWSSVKPTNDYITDKNKTPRFVTEFGLQSLPCKMTAEKFVPAEKMQAASAAIEKHNYQPNGNERLNYYMAENFKVPASIDEFIYLSQLTQARAVKKYVENLRANSDVNSGVMYWQLNDVFASISWAGIDFKGCKKALHYYAKRFYGPIAILPIAEFGNGGQRTLDKLLKLSVCVNNQSGSSMSAMLKCRIVGCDFEIIDEFSRLVSVSPGENSTINLPSSFVRPVSPEKCYIHFALENDSGRIAENSYFYLPDKYMEFPEQEVEMSAEKIAEGKWQVDIGSNSAVRDLCIACDFDAEFSDNFFDLLLPNGKSIIIETADDVDDIMGSLKIISVSSTHGTRPVS